MFLLCVKCELWSMKVRDFISFRVGDSEMVQRKVIVMQETYVIIISNSVSDNLIYGFGNLCHFCLRIATCKLV